MKTLYFMQIKYMILPTRDQQCRFCLTSLLQTLLISPFFCVGLTRRSSSQRWGLVRKLLCPHSQRLGEIVPYNQNCYQTILMKCPLVKRAVFSPFLLPQEQCSYIFVASVFVETWRTSPTGRAMVTRCSFTWQSGKNSHIRRHTVPLLPRKHREQVFALSPLSMQGKQRIRGRQ